MALTREQWRNSRVKLGNCWPKRVSAHHKGTWCQRAGEGGGASAEDPRRLTSTGRLAVKTGQWSKYRIKSSSASKSYRPAGRAPLVLYKEIFPGKTFSRYVRGDIWIAAGEPAEEMNLHSLNYMLKSIENEKPNHPRSAALEEILI